jgi:succinyl-CoA synthetase alpha subunit
MSILVDKTRASGAGLRPEGTFHAQQCIAYGTKIVGGVTPGKGGTKHLDRAGVQHRAEAVKRPAPTPRDLRAAAVRGRRHDGSRRRKIALVVCITEGIRRWTW